MSDEHVISQGPQQSCFLDLNACDFYLWEN